MLTVPGAWLHLVLSAAIAEGARREHRRNAKPQREIHFPRAVTGAEASLHGQCRLRIATLMTDDQAPPIAGAACGEWLSLHDVVIVWREVVPTWVSLVEPSTSAIFHQA